jgi:hypothetical protein
MIMCKRKKKMNRGIIGFLKLIFVSLHNSHRLRILVVSSSVTDYCSWIARVTVLSLYQLRTSKRQFQAT